MKAATRTKYGTAKVLSVKEIETPVPNDDELLIKVHAATANRSDYHVLTGRPFFMRLFTGLFKPKLSTTGSDFAGEVVTIGKNVRSFKVGDRIMGFGSGFGCGSHAEYFVLPETRAINRATTIPGQTSYEEAAACCEGSFYAASCTNNLHPKKGQSALVYGATGAIGSAYVQFFKAYDLYVTAVCPGKHAALMRSLGADKVIDYTIQDFTKDDQRYDFVLDAVGKTSFFTCKRLLKKKGLFTSSGGAENLFLVFITPLFGGKKVFFKAPKDVMLELEFIKGLLEKGKFKPVIDRVYPLEKIAEAFDYVASGQKLGNVVIRMETNKPPTRHP